VGLTGLGRGNLLYLVPGAWLLLAWEKAPRPRKLRAAAALLAGTVLVITPVTLRNAVVGDDLVLISSNAGLNLRIGQQVHFGGRFGPVIDPIAMQADPELRDQLKIAAGHTLEPSEVSRRHAAAALAEATADPGATLVHYLRKAYRFWSGYELPQITSWTAWRARSAGLKWLPVPFVLLSAGGLLGLLALRGRPRRVLAVLILGYFLSLWLFFPTARYRLPMVPWLALSTAALLVTGGRVARAGRRRRAAAWLGGLGIALVALWPHWSALPRAEVFWQVAMNDASRAADLGDRAAILAAGRRAEVSLPDNPETPFRLARYLERTGDYEMAGHFLEEARRHLPNHPFILHSRGLNLEQQGLLTEAAAAFAAAAALDSSWADPCRAQARVLRRSGDPVAAIGALEEAARREPGRAETRSNLALLLAEIGRLEEARELLGDLTRDFPDYLPGWFNLALVEYRLGRLPRAREALQRAHAVAERGVSVEQREQLERLEKALGGG
jgi:tetratricopeptide (TPR) repeat protein